MNGFMHLRTFERTPSADEFASQVESKNVPAVFNGCVKDWKAFSCWNPYDAGLDYLQELAGSFVVEAMLSRSAPIFYGDLRSHERVPLSFSTFIDFCKQHLPNTDDGHSVCFESQRCGLSCANVEERCPSPGVSQQIYLAQVPILNIEDKERVQLVTLIDDIQIPHFLRKQQLVSINLWMNSAHARSSTHHDPHHNLLCIVAGCKQVVLWPPSATPALYPMPVYGEASNHSRVSLDNPDFSIHPRANCLMKYSQMVILNAGDALFIPEGWFHQVDSDNLTIAVNFWWESNLMSGMLEHMDAYYLRRIVSRMVEKERKLVLHGIESDSVGKPELHGSVSNCKDSDSQGCDFRLRDEGLITKKVRMGIMLQELDLSAQQALHELVSLVHARFDLNELQPTSFTSMADSSINLNGICKDIRVSNLYHLEDDPVAKIIWTLQPLTFHNIFLSLAENFPRTLEALILHLLSPVGAEVLTRKFDEMDQQITEKTRNFYKVFYGVFDDPSTAMNSILNGKESFASQVFVNVLDQNLGVNLNELTSLLK